MDAASIIPRLGVVLDGTNAILYLTEGDFTNAGLSALALLPVVGDVIGGIALGAKAIKFTDKVSDTTKLSEDLYKSEMVPDGIKKLYESSNSLENIHYTEKMIEQMKIGDFHSFSELVRQEGSAGKKTIMQNGDGSYVLKVEIESDYQGHHGNFEFIIEADSSCNHRFFNSTD